MFFFGEGEWDSGYVVLLKIKKSVIIGEDVFGFGEGFGFVEEEKMKFFDEDKLVVLKFLNFVFEFILSSEEEGSVVIILVVVVDVFENFFEF